MQRSDAVILDNFKNAVIVMALMDEAGVVFIHKPGKEDRSRSHYTRREGLTG
jgi:hypothetical protein